MKIKPVFLIVVILSFFSSVHCASAASVNATYISPGATVFIGESGLNLADALTGTQIAWYEFPTDPEPRKIYDIAAMKTDFYVNQADFVGYTGNWYCWTGSNNFVLSFIVADPSIDVKIWDITQNKYVTGSYVPRSDKLTFRIETNGYMVAQPAMRPRIIYPDWDNSGGNGSYYGINPATGATIPMTPEGFIDIKVKTPDNNVLLALFNGTAISAPGNVQIPLRGMWVDTAPWYWGNYTGGYNMYWNTSALDAIGQNLYPAGTYTVTAEFNINSMKDNYRNGGAYYTGKTISEARTFTLTARPIVSFTSDVTSGTAPLPVSFTDLSTGSPTGWAWFFGDENYAQPWTQVNASSGWPSRVGHSSVVMPDGSILLMGGAAMGLGNANDTWRSMDNGTTWMQMNASSGWSARLDHTSVVMPDGSIVLMGGSDGANKNDTWRSIDNGATWVQMNASSGWQPRYFHSSVALPDGSIVLMGGDAASIGKTNDTWQSNDGGLTWTEVNASSGWSARAAQSSVVMPDGSIVLMGGYSSDGYYNDTWRSTDNGVTWILMNASAGWSARYLHRSIVMPDGSIVLMGGSTAGWFRTNDVWRSTDYGATWSQVTAGAGWSARYFHTSIALPDGSIVLMGGDSDVGYKNDTWRFMAVGSSEQDPSHTYTAPGKYNVSLQAYNAGGYNSTRKTGYITVTGSSTPQARFQITKDFIINSDDNSIASGSHDGRLRYGLNLNHPVDGSGTLFGDLSFEISAQDITRVDWEEYAQWDESSAQWDFPEQFAIEERADNFALGAHADTSITGPQQLNLSMNRGFNQTEFSGLGYQLIQANVTFTNTDFQWVWWAVDFPSNELVNMTLVPGSFVTDAPVDADISYQRNERVFFMFNRSAITPGVTYHFSVTGRVEPTSIPVEAIPRISVGQGFYHDQTTAGAAYSVDMPSGLLPANVSAASLSMNVSATWELVEDHHLVSALEQRVQPAVPAAQFDIGRNVVYRVPGDLITSGSHTGIISYGLGIYNTNDTSHGTLGDLTFEIYADNLAMPGWRNYAEWDSSHVLWQFLGNKSVPEQTHFGTGVDTPFTEPVDLYADLSREINETNFESTGYQLVTARLTFTDINTSQWQFLEFQTRSDDAVNPTIVTGSLVTDAPLRSVWGNDHTVHLDLNPHLMDPFHTYTASCVVRVEPTAGIPVVYKPEIILGQRLYQNSTEDGSGYSADMLSSFLPAGVNSVSVTTNVSNAWVLNRADHIFSVLQEVRDIPLTSNFIAMFRGNPQHTGVFHNGGIEPTNQEKWHFPIGFTYDSSPAVADGVVYVGGTDNGGMSGQLYAIDIATATERWRYPMERAVTTSPAVVNGSVYIGCDYGKLSAINATTGIEKWHVDDYVASSPTIDGGIVYFGSYDGNLYAVYAENGTEKWHFTTGNDIMGSSPAVAEEIVFVGSMDHNLYAVYAENGTEKWHFTTGGVIYSSPAVSNGVVYIGSDDYNLYAIYAENGTEKWHFTTGYVVYSSAAISNGVIYFGSYDGNLYAVNANNGTEKWHFTTGGWIRSSPAVADGVIYVGSWDGNLYAVAANNGNFIWQFTTSNPVGSSPTVSNGTVYFGGVDKKLYAIGGLTQPLTIFSANVTSGSAPLTVEFTDASNFIPTGWNWDFGDGDTTNSNEQNPVHTYLNSGTYTVSLNASNADGSIISTKTNYIIASPSGSPVWVEQFYIDKNPLLNGDSFNVTIKGQAFQKYYLYFYNLSVPAGGYPVIVPGQPNVNATPAAEAEIELYPPYISALGVPNTKSIITIPGSGIINITYTTNAATINRTFLVYLASPGPSGWPIMSTIITIRSVLPAVPGPGETQIATNASWQSTPSIYGDRIVWTDGRNGNPDIYLYDISTHTESQITTNVSGQYGPSIYGDKIVWTDYRNGLSDIYMYNLSTQTESQITTNVSWKYWPSIYSDRIVWEDGRNGLSDIYLYDLSTQTESQITTNVSGQYGPSIYGDKIVWTDYRNGLSDIYLYDLSTQTESQITTNASEQYGPSIYGDKIVWTDYRNGNPDIYLFDLATNTDQPICTDTADQYNPRIFRNYVVWEDYRNGLPDIYLYTFALQLRPNASFVWSPAQPVINQMVSFDASASTDPDGIITAYLWDFNDGTSILNQTTPFADHTFQQPRVHNVTLTVIDDMNFTNTTFQPVSVFATKETVNTTINGATVGSSGGGQNLTIDRTTIEGGGGSVTNTSTSVTLQHPTEFWQMIEVRGSTVNETTPGNFTVDNVNEVLMKSTPITAVLNETLGDVSVALDIALKQFVEGAQMEVKVMEGANTSTLTHFQLAANISGTDVAYTVEFSNTALFNSNLTTNATRESQKAIITMSVSHTWVSRYDNGTNNQGRGSINIIRYPEYGDPKVLATRFDRYDPATNLDWFDADSPDGLSIFGLITMHVQAAAQGNQAAPAGDTGQAAAGGGSGGGGGGVYRAGTYESPRQNGAQETQPGTTLAPPSPSTTPDTGNPLNVKMPVTAVTTNIGLVAWLLGIMEHNPVIVVIVIAGVGAVAYFGVWKRRIKF